MRFEIENTHTLHTLNLNGKLRSDVLKTKQNYQTKPMSVHEQDSNLQEILGNQPDIQLLHRT